ncbi:MAG: hypothetical protein WDN29_14750 [Methylovirgula sp.]
MHYLGGITGSGMLMCDGENIARVSYDFDGFRRPSSEIVGNGQITFAVSALKDVFGRDVQIQTDDGKLLKLKFSEKTMDPRADVAHVDVFGDLASFTQQSHREKPETL